MEENSGSFSIKYWKQDDRPREKLLLKGREVLSDAELIAILLGSGSRSESAVQLAQRILYTSDNKLQRLSRLSIEELRQFKGIGEAKAVTIAAALELGKRHGVEDEGTVTHISGSEDAFAWFKPRLGDLPHEEFWVMYINNSNKILRTVQLSKGGITGTMVDIRLLLKKAIECHATAFILAHNHPSGILQPSEADTYLTKKIGEASKSMDIKLLDHLIVTEKGYFSFADEGFLRS